jgi:malonate-semialdehyde dehydrogenase (acetylating)/methylmalonate-semialdehyde dehydrogenase
MVEVPSTVRNYINGDWILVDDAESLAVINPATGERLATTPLSPASQVDQAAKAATGKRVQAQGGAKNPMVVLPDADLEAATTIVADSAFGCAGQRCLAASLAITVGESGKTFTEAIGTVARERRVGSGLDAAIEMGPVISAQSRDRIERLIGTGVGEGGGWLQMADRPRSLATRMDSLSGRLSWPICRLGASWPAPKSLVRSWG